MILRSVIESLAMVTIHKHSLPNPLFIETLFPPPHAGRAPLWSSALSLRVTVNVSESVVKIVHKRNEKGSQG
jgi:hypothetical protein